MRRSIVIKATLKGGHGKPEIRLFTMDDRQSELFESCVVSLHAVSHWPMERCAIDVEKAIVRLLQGRFPSTGAPRMILDLQSAFSPLKAGDMRRLPRAGCPRERVTALILGIQGLETLKNDEGVTTANVQRTVLIELDEDQADFYNEAITEVRNRDGCSKDDAWLWVNNLIGRLIGGQTLSEPTEEVLLMRAVNLFPGLTKEQAEQLPLATEDDVRHYSFTTDRVRENR